MTVYAKHSRGFDEGVEVFAYDLIPLEVDHVWEASSGHRWDRRIGDVWLAADEADSEVLNGAELLRFHGPVVDHEEVWHAASQPLKQRINRLERQVIVAMAKMPMSCKYHGADFDKLGWEQGQPRCDSCKQPYLVRQLLLAAGGAVSA